MVRQQEKCVTGVDGIVRSPFGGGGAFVVAEDMGRIALAAFRLRRLLRVPADLIISHARPALRGAQSRCKPCHNLKGLRARVKGFAGLWPGFRVGGVQEDAMTTAGLAEKGQVGVAGLVRRVDEGWERGKRPLSWDGEYRFASIDLGPG